MSIHVGSTVDEYCRIDEGAFKPNEKSFDGSFEWVICYDNPFSVDFQHGHSVIICLNSVPPNENFSVVLKFSNKVELTVNYRSK